MKTYILYIYMSGMSIFVVHIRVHNPECKLENSALGNAMLLYLYCFVRWDIKLCILYTCIL